MRNRNRIARMISLVLAVTFCILLPVGEAGYADEAYTMTEAYANQWARSDVRAWLNGLTKSNGELLIDGSNGVESQNNYLNYFKTSELNLFQPREVTTTMFNDSQLDGTVSEVPTKDRFWLPSGHCYDDTLSVYSDMIISADPGYDLSDNNTYIQKITNGKTFNWKNIIPIALWSPQDGMLRSANFSTKIACLTAEHGYGVEGLRDVDDQTNVYPCATISLGSGFFAAYAYANTALYPGDLTAQWIDGYAKLGKTDYSDNVPSWGMYLKNISLDGISGSLTWVHDYNNNIYNLTFTSGSFLPRDKYLVAQAYKDWNSQRTPTENANRGESVYVGAKKIENDSVTSVTFSYLGDLSGYTVKVWLEEPASDDQLARTSVPLTFKLGSNGQVSSSNEAKSGNPRVFAYRDDLGCSWGTYEDEADCTVLEQGKNDYYIGKNATWQKLNIGTGADSKPIEWWIVSGDDTSLMLYQASSNTGTQSSQGYYFYQFNSSAEEYKSDSYLKNPSLTLDDLTAADLADISSKVHLKTDKSGTELTAKPDSYSVQYCKADSNGKMTGSEWTDAPDVSGSYFIRVKFGGAAIDGTGYAPCYSGAKPVAGITAAAATPEFSVAAGEYDEVKSVTISCETDGATIYYTKDGTDPTTGSDEYSGAITLTRDTTLRAIAVKDGYDNSAIATAAYKIKTYEVRFLANGGSGEMDPMRAAKGETITLPECGFTAPTYKTFSHWEVSGLDGYYIDENKEAQIAGNCVTAAGIITVTANWIEAPQASVTKAPEGCSLTYNGADQALVTAGTADGGKMIYALGKDGTTEPQSGWSEEIPEQKNIGTYYVWYKARGDATHSDSAAGYATATVSVRLLTITAKEQRYAYNGQIQGEGDTTYADAAQIAEKITVEGLQGNDAITGITIDGQGQEVGVYSLVPSNAAIGTATDNYDITYVNGRLVIYGPKLNITVNGDSGTKVYNSEEQTRTGTVTATSSDAAFDASKFSYTGSTAVRGTDAGEYTTPLTEAYCAYNDGNYEIEWTIGSPITLTVSKAGQAAPTAPTAKSIGVTSVTLNPVDNCEYSRDGVTWQTGTEFAGLTGGTEYTFFQRYKGDRNHEPSPASPALTVRTVNNLYVVTKSKGAEHTRGNDEPAAYTVERSINDNETFDRFVTAETDGTEIPEDSRITERGSLILTLKSNYLDTLAEGDHQVKIRFDDGEVTASLKINAAPPTPTVTPKPTDTPTPKPTDAPTPTPKPTDAPTPTPKPTDAPTPTPKPRKVPKTGDSAPLGLWLGLILLGMIAFGGTKVFKYRK